MNPLVGHILSLLISSGSLLLAYLVWRGNKSDKVSEDISNLKTNYKVLEEKVNRDIKDIEKLDAKLDDIIKELR